MAQTMTLIFTVNIAAAVGALLFGHVQDRIGHRRALALTLCAWLVMVGIAVSTRSLAGFWAAAAVAGLCIGSSQSAGRAMVGLLAPKSRLAEFFALWTFAIQLAAVCGPLSYTFCRTSKMLTEKSGKHCFLCMETVSSLLEDVRVRSINDRC